MKTIERQLEPTPTLNATESPVVLRTTDLRKSFGGQVVLDGIDLELRRGEVVLLQGENGSGKTTLLNILTGNLEPDAGSISYSTNGHETAFCFPQPWWNRINPVGRFAPDTVARLGIGRTWQDVRLFDSMSLRDNITVAQSCHGENPFVALLSWKTKADDTRSDELLGQLGLSGREQSSGDMISLGQSKRVAIARAVAAGAKILLLDEPLAGLDRDGIDDVLGMLRNLVERHEITLVVIEHVFNQSHLRKLISSHWQLADGKLTFGRSGDMIRGQLSEQPHWFQILSEISDDVITEPLPRGAKLTRFRIASRFKSKPALTIQDLIVKRGNRTVIGLDDHGRESGFNLTISEGEIAVLQAPNGWGKSSLSYVLSHIHHELRGNIAFGGQCLHRIPTWQRWEYGIRASGVDRRLFPSFTIAEVSRLARRPPESILFDGKVTRSRLVSSLSGGEKQSVLLDATLSDNKTAHLVILDEAFTALDYKRGRTLAKLLLALRCAVLLLQPSISTDDESTNE